jgi:hypothetical protein
MSRISGCTSAGDLPGASKLKKKKMGGGKPKFIG